ncbi:hypothetical protein GQX73_g7076 [Xylaria multiplex]|uniref:WW domain-containing protein n=1 Tax=Xylaria multiplex TaxID=323545 RepID=A0A7C8ILD2_9PEZI|nr:hypothetical protein GQX73_g7076 [Xylaria multiplex]
MAGPASPNAGPTFEPPHLPPGWIAQWDGSSKKYYYVQLSTGVSQWEIPTNAAPGATPAQSNEHPYGVPGPREVITHPDGTQTLKHPDGRMEPILPPESSRGFDGPTGDRGFGNIAANALLSQFSGASGKPHSGSDHGSGGARKSGWSTYRKPCLFSSGGKPEQTQNYHGGQHQQSHSSSGLAGQVVGGVTGMFGGHHGKQSGQDYGYSNSGQSGSYSGQAPPTSYQPPNGSTASYSSPSSNQHSTPSYNPPPTQHGAPSYPPPPGQHSTSSYSQGGHQNPPYGSGPSSNYGHSPASHEYRDSSTKSIRGSSPPSHHMGEPTNNNILRLLLLTLSSTHPLHRRAYHINTLANLRMLVMGLLYSMANTEAKQDTILGTGDRIFT